MKSFWHQQSLVGEVVRHTIGAAGLAEAAEQSAHDVLHLLIGIQNDSSRLIVEEARRQRHAQFPLARLIEPATQQTPRIKCNSACDIVPLSPSNN